jgi:hypothetical protein
MCEKSDYRNWLFCFAGNLPLAVAVGEPSMSNTDDPALNLLNLFSLRAMRVIFAARLNAGQRGAIMIELGDLLLGIVLEDRDMIDCLPSEIDAKLSPALSLPPRSPLISSEKAGALIVRIETSLSRSEPIAHTKRCTIVA